MLSRGIQILEITQYLLNVSQYLFHYYLLIVFRTIRVVYPQWLHYSQSMPLAPSHSLSPCAVCVLVCCVRICRCVCDASMGGCCLWGSTHCVQFTLMCMQGTHCVCMCACMGISVCVCVVCVVWCVGACVTYGCALYTKYMMHNQTTCVIQPCISIHTYTHMHAFISCVFAYACVMFTSVYASVSVCAWCVCRNSLHLCATCVPTGHTYTHFHTHTYPRSLHTLCVPHSTILLTGPFSLLHWLLCGPCGIWLRPAGYSLAACMALSTLTTVAHYAVTPYISLLKAVHIISVCQCS
jgi:hypothetical protein